ncbi:MAG: DUF2304 domain-containing protein [Bacteroidota bacterium]
MEFRVFQWLIPLVAMIFSYYQLLRYRNGKSSLREALLAIVALISIALLAVFPDKISDFIAQLFGIKSNTNAVLFAGLGVLFYFQFRLYQLQVEQRRTITELVRMLAIKEYEKEL